MLRLCLFLPYVMAAGLAITGASTATAGDAPPVDFSRSIRPIFSDNCYTCHGPDEAERQTEWRLDLRESALGELDSGDPAVVPGDSSASGIYRRVAAEDEDERMPPPDAQKKLTAEQVSLIKAWIDQGAGWREHWSFVTPKRPNPPQVKGSRTVRNPIDRFVLERLAAEHLTPSPEAEPETLIRRVTLDLTGLPPTPAQIDAFVSDRSERAYEKLVDRLLSSPRYGEQMARYWLDAARYGDTHGLHLDNIRSMWPYRDWVIEAFNRNMPFDRFTTEQLAGDLLPNPGRSQLIASGFNRAHATTSEGGSIPEEYVVRYAVDRTDTVGTVWMGLTVGCAVCHDHKFDPISQKEFYRLYAYFNNTAEDPMDGNKAYQQSVDMPMPSDEQSAGTEAFQQELAELKTRIAAELAGIDYKDPMQGVDVKQPERRDYVWIDDSLPRGAKPATVGGPRWEFVAGPEHPVNTLCKSTTLTAEGLAQHTFTGAKPGLTVGQGDVLFAHVWIDEANPPRQIMLQFNDGTWEHRAYWGENLIDWGKPDTVGRRHVGPLPEPGGWVRLEVNAAKVGLKPAAAIGGWAFTQFGGTVHWDTAGITTKTPQGNQGFQSMLAWEETERSTKAAGLPEPVAKAVLMAPDKRNEAQQKQVRDYFLEYVYANTRKSFGGMHKQISEVEKRKTELEEQIPWALITKERDELRPAHVLRRGSYENPGEEVVRGVPAVLPPMAPDAPDNRLGLAGWLVSPSHPLTARVTVNRFWQHYFGTGLVRTAEDFGSQGEWPSHPELLDWLATEFIGSGWDVRHMQRLIVTSATYRQSSRRTPELAKRDPLNRLLARGPRYRMDAEMVRDNALAVSGLLVEQIGGPSVKPYQPDGLWNAVAYTKSNTARFVQDQGDALYRRSLYTFWKRTSPPPTMAILDAPSRETCVVRRARTNTPLSALALMNDIQFFEAARSLAERMMTDGGPTPQERIAYGFRLATARRPGPSELNVLLAQYRAHLAEFSDNEESARRLVTVGESPIDESLDVCRLAAWTMVANLILNLDETITKG